jgi:dihydroorotate dehydrogenase (NAD+) catalytic subunit
VASAWDAIELMLAGATAVQVGTASFADPGAAASVQSGIAEWASERGLPRLADIAAIA